MGFPLPLGFGVRAGFHPARAIPIDIGSPATDRALYSVSTNAYILKENPANHTGKLTSIQIYVNKTFDELMIFTAYCTSVANTFSSRDYDEIGALGAGLHTVAIDLEVQEGDYIGWNGKIGDAGRIEADVTGEGYWYLLRTTFVLPFSDVLWTFAADRTQSLYGIGEG